MRKFHGHQRRVKSVAISQDGQYAASGSGWPSGDRTVRVWEMDSGKQKYSFNAGFNVMSVAFSPDGKSVAAAGFSNRFKTWDIDSGKPVLDATMNDVTRIEELRYSPDGSEIVLSKSRKPELVLLDASTGEETRRFQLQDYTLGYKFIPGQNTLVVGYGDGSIGLVDFTTGKERKRLQRPPLTFDVTDVHQVPPYCLDVSPDGTLVAAGYRGEYSAHIWDIETGQPLVDIVTAEQRPEQIAFTPDGNHVVLAGSVGVVSLIDVASGQVVGSTERIDSHGWAMTMMPDGQSVLVGGGPKISNSFSGLGGFFATPAGDFDLRLWKLGRANAEVLAEASQPVRPTLTIEQLSQLPDDDFKMVEIDLSGSSLLRDQDLATLSNLDQLERLDLSGSAITESGLKQLGKLPNLHSLSLARTPIQSLATNFGSLFPELKNLDLHATGLKKVDPDAVAGLKSLESIDLSMTSIGDEAVDAFADMENLRKVDLAATEVTDAAARTLSEMDSLERLNLAGTRIGEAESLVQGQWSSLQSLNVINTDVPKVAIERVLEAA